MEKVFEALRSRHPGYEVIDLGFTVLGFDPDPLPETFAEELAEAIRTAEPRDISEL